MEVAKTVRPLGKSLRRKLAEGALWSVLGSALSQAMTFVALALAARSLGTVSYGELGFVHSTASLVSLLIGSPLALTATRYMAEGRSAGHKDYEPLLPVLLGLALAIPLALSLGFYIIRPFTADGLVAGQVLGQHKMVFSLLASFSCVNAVQLGVLAGLESFRSVAMASMSRGAAGILLVPMGVSAFGVPGALTALLLSVVLGIWISHGLLVKQYAAFGISFDYRGLSLRSNALRNFTVPAALSAFLTLPFIWWSNVLLAEHPNGLHEVGIFNAANQWRMALIVVCSLATAPILPALSRLWAEGEAERFGRVMLIAIAFALGVGVAATAGAFFGASAITTFIFGRDYGDAAPVLFSLTVSVVFSNMASVVGSALQAIGAMWSALLLNLTWVAVFGAGCLTSLHLGALGIGNAYIYACAVQAALSAIYIYFRLRQRRLLG